MGLPNTLSSGLRRRLLLRLIVNGCAQAAIVCATTWLVLIALTAHTSTTNALIAATGLILAAAAMIGLRMLARMDAERLGQSYVTNVRLRLFDALTNTPARAPRQARHGLTMIRLTFDLGTLKSWISDGLARAVVAIISLAGSLVALLLISPAIALTALVGISLCAIGAMVLSQELRQHIRAARHRRGQLAGDLGERILGLTTLRQFNRITTERRKLKRRSRQLADALVVRAGHEAALQGLADAAMPIMLALVVIGGISLHWQEVSGATLAAALFVLGLVVSALRDLARAWCHRLVFEQGRTRFEQLLAAPPTDATTKPMLNLEADFPLSVAYRHVALAPALVDFGAEINAGDAIVLTGSTGSGKSTLLELTAGLIAPETGEIMLNNRPMSEYRAASVKRKVKLVTPEMPLLRGTVAENLELGAVDLSPTRADQLYRMVDPDGVLAQGLATKVQEFGRNLPSIIRARLNLARALASSPKLLLIDDPLILTDESALQAIKQLIASRRCTVIIAANPAIDVSVLGVSGAWITAKPTLILRMISLRNHKR